MSHRDLDKDVIEAASHLEFVAHTPGLTSDEPSFEETLIDIINYEYFGVAFPGVRDQLDQERRERILRGWKKLRTALEVRRASLSEPETPDWVKTRTCVTCKNDGDCKWQDAAEEYHGGTNGCLSSWEPKE